MIFLKKQCFHHIYFTFQSCGLTHEFDSEISKMHPSLVKQIKQLIAELNLTA